MDGRAVPLCESDGQIAAVGRRGMLWFKLVPAMGPWEAVFVETGVPEIASALLRWGWSACWSGWRLSDVVDCSAGGSACGERKRRRLSVCRLVSPTPH